MTLYILPIVIFVSIYVVVKLSTYLLPVVEAGPIIGKRSTGMKRAPMPTVSAYQKLIKTKEYFYRRFIVQGICMVPKGINDGDVIDVKIFNKNFTSNEIQKGDLALIFLNDKNFRGYKVRIVDLIKDDEETGEKVAYTYYYDSECNRIESTQPHALKLIKGVVDMSGYENRHTSKPAA